MDESQTPCVTLVVKNPSRGDNVHKIVVSVETQVASIKQRLAEEYEGKPPPGQQTVGNHHTSWCLKSTPTSC
jgi:hypothetical protein